MIQHGWPENKSTLPLLASPYFDMRDELSAQDGLIFKGERVVVPKAARSGLQKVFTIRTLELMVALTERVSVFIGLG